MRSRNSSSFSRVKRRVLAAPVAVGLIDVLLPLSRLKVVHILALLLWLSAAPAAAVAWPALIVAMLAGESTSVSRCIGTA